MNAEDKQLFFFFFPCFYTSLVTFFFLQHTRPSITLCHHPEMNPSDDASLRLALELQIQDAEGLSRPSRQGRGRKRKASDFDVALAVYQEHLTTEIQSVGGRLPTAPTDALSFRPRKRPATGTRRVPTPATRVNPPRQAKASVWQTAVPAQTAAPADSSSALQCMGCLEVLDGDFYIRAPCSHLYCGTCLARFFTVATTDGGVFPASCCVEPIPLADAHRFLPAEVVTRYEMMQLETDTQAADRRYCYVKACGSFIPPADFAGDRATCRSCPAQTCILCRAAAHDGVCADDSAPDEIRALVAANGLHWKQCPRCKNWREKMSGCPHMGEFKVASRCRACVRQM